VTRPPGRSLFYGYTICLAGFFIILVAYGVRFSYGVFFTPMATQLGLSSAATSAAYSISMIMEGISSLVLGMLSDRYGPRWILTVSGILIGLGYCLMPLVHSGWQLYLLYGVLIGIGQGGIFIPIISTIARWFDARRSLMTGVVASGIGLGMLVLSPLSSGLIQRFSWETTFVALGVVILMVILIAAQFFKRDPYGMGLKAYGEERLSTAAVEQKLADGFSFNQALRTNQFWLISSVVLLFGFYATSVTVHVVPDAIDHRIPAQTAAAILAVNGAFMSGGRVLLGNLADRVGNRRVFILGLVLSVLTLVWILAVKTQWAYFVFAAVIGFSGGGVGTAQSTLLATLFGIRSVGPILALCGLWFTIGAALGPFVTGYIFDITHSYFVALGVCGIVAFLALILALMLRPLRPVRMIPGSR
jgi:MFS family permease